MADWDSMLALAEQDVEALRIAEVSYGDSWKRRGGVGAFMMLARKWDRLETQAHEAKWDILEAIVEDTRDEGIVDDINDLIRYLMLVREEAGRRAEEGEESNGGN